MMRMLFWDNPRMRMFNEMTRQGFLFADADAVKSLTYMAAYSAGPVKLRPVALGVSPASDMAVTCVTNR